MTVASFPKRKFHRWLPLFAIAVMLFIFFYFKLYHYLNFESLQQHRQLLLQWKNANYLLTLGIYFLLYLTAAATSLPCNMIFYLTGGFLFGLFPGTIYALLCATLGSTLSFLAIKLALSRWLEQRAGKWLALVEHDYKDNAFYYLISLRLIPIFPFSIVNIIAGLLGTPLSTFIAATFLGAIPAALLYSSLGHNLEIVFANQALHVSILYQPKLFLPLLCLGALAILPIIYKHLKGPKKCLNPP